MVIYSSPGSKLPQPPPIAIMGPRLAASESCSGEAKDIPSGEVPVRLLTTRAHSLNFACAACSWLKESVRCSTSSSNCFLTALSCCELRLSRLTARILSVIRLFPSYFLFFFFFLHPPSSVKEKLRKADLFLDHGRPFFLYRSFELGKGVIMVYKQGQE